VPASIKFELFWLESTTYWSIAKSLTGLGPFFSFVYSSSSEKIFLGLNTAISTACKSSASSMVSQFLSYCDLFSSSSSSSFCSSGKMVKEKASSFKFC
jgi:hypothetical protein